MRLLMSLKLVACIIICAMQCFRQWQRRLERICWEEVVYGKQGCGDDLRLVTPTFIIFFLQTYFARLIHEDYVLLR